MKRIILFFVTLALAVAAVAAGRDTYTVIVSLDGFRWDYTEAFDTPFFDQLAQQGVKAVMMPSFPSKTFPNHYTLATGLVPDHHGIIGNKFRIRDTGKRFSLSDIETRTDPNNYGGDPIWLTAKRQGVKSATIYWVGSDVPIKGEYATYWKDYLKDRLTHEQRIDEAVRLLSLPEKERPHLVMVYFEEPDASGHHNGPITRQTRQAVERMDSLMSVLGQRLASLPIASQINLIITGDHGMTWVSPERQLLAMDFLKEKWVKSIENDFPALIYAAEPQYIDSIYNTLKQVDHIRVWRRGELPAYLNYGTNKNMGDVVVLADVGWVFDKKPKKDLGTHGYDHTCSDMWVGFRAIGPDFKQGYTRAHTFHNVSIYPLLCHLLGIVPSPCDGSLDEVSDIINFTRK
ncbi:MAG: alkaline phosphatase family protein [Muribaculaceae bacterium]|nr:alkaline phosphatase family protein [Muribaculaceae bacterium]